MLEAAIETAARNLSWYDDETTKNCKDIIKNHQEFFDGLSNVSRIMLLAIHFLLWTGTIEWLISCHSAQNIESIKMFADTMDIKEEQITLFVT